MTSAFFRWGPQLSLGQMIHEAHSWVWDPWYTKLTNTWQLSTAQLCHYLCYLLTYLTVSIIVAVTATHLPKQNIANRRPSAISMTWRVVVDTCCGPRKIRNGIPINIAKSWQTTKFTCNITTQTQKNNQERAIIYLQSLRKWGCCIIVCICQICDRKVGWQRSETSRSLSVLYDVDIEASACISQFSLCYAITGVALYLYDRRKYSTCLYQYLINGPTDCVGKRLQQCTAFDRRRHTAPQFHDCRKNVQPTSAMSDRRKWSQSADTNGKHTAASDTIAEGKFR